MKIDKLNRRMFLQGMGKAAVAIPFLGSLTASQSEAMMDVPPRFIFISCQNGAQAYEQWYPSNLPSTAKSLFTDHNYHTGAINHTTANGISPIFDNKFNPYIGRMNFLRGLDQIFRTFGNHEGAALLGNVRAAHGSMGFCPMIPTIDQIMAYSNGFYPGNGVGYIPSISINPIGSARNTSYGFSNPFKKTGNIQKVPSIHDPAVLFEKLFGGTTADSRGRKIPVVDTVLDDYKRIKRSDRLSKEEGLQLDQYIDILAQTDQKFKIDVMPDKPQCRGLVKPPSSPPSNHQNANEADQIDKLTDLLVLAFMCNRTRLTTIHFNRVNGIADGSSHSSPAWHWASHNSQSGDPVNRATARDVLLNVYKWVADNALYVLLQKMDAVTESNGMTMLDNSLIHFSTASMNGPHNQRDLPTALFGSAGGFFKTGQYIDYRNRNDGIDYGIVHNQYLTNVMYAMGLKKADWNMKSLGFSAPGFPETAEGYGWYHNLGGSGGGGSHAFKYSGSRNNVIGPLPDMVNSSKLSVFGT